MDDSAKARRLLDEWLSGCSDSSRRVYASAIERAAQSLGRHATQIDWPHLAPGDVDAVREQLLARGFSMSTINGTLTAIRSVVRHAWQAGLLSLEKRASLDEVLGARAWQPKSRAVQAHEVAAIVEACGRDGSLLALRDIALIGLAATTGLRRTELALARIEDFDPQSGRLVVHRKGDDHSVVVITNGAHQALCDWVNARGPQPGPLFVRLVRRRERSYEVTSLGISSRGIADILARRSREAGIDPMRLVDLRRRVADELLQAGKDVATVANLLGYTCVATMRRYARHASRGVAPRLYGEKSEFPYHHVPIPSSIPAANRAPMNPV
jgi:site-specific recombinase XerD